MRCRRNGRRGNGLCIHDMSLHCPTCSTSGSHRVARVHGPGGARFHPRPHRCQAACVTALYRICLVGDSGAGGQRGDRCMTPTKNSAPTPDEETRNNPLSALRAPPRERAPCSSTSKPCNMSPSTPLPPPRSWPPPSLSSHSDTNLGEKGSLYLSSVIFSDCWVEGYSGCVLGHFREAI